MIKRGGFGKSGAGHLEMIISFLFFTGFVFFLLTTLTPYDVKTLSSSVVAGLYNSFEKEVHTNLTTIFLKANYTGSNSCFYIQLPPDFFEYNLTKSLVKDVYDVEINSEFNNDNLNIASNENFYKIAISPEFSGNTVNGCEQLSNYSLGSLIERRISSYSSLVNMSARYETDYEGLRSDLNIPEVFDFAITSKELPEINMTRLIPRLGDVVSNDYVLEVLKDTGEIINSRFTLRVW